MLWIIIGAILLFGVLLCAMFIHGSDMKNRSAMAKQMEDDEQEKILADMKKL